jgi:AcrR family transcriptional regulator
MPKIVDHDARREEIAHALWRIVRRDGIGAASVRTVAAEASSSAGAIRYYFPDQHGLLCFAMELVSRRVGERIRSLQPAGEPRTRAVRYLEEVIPLDEERQAEFEVWLAFVAQSLAEAEAGGPLQQTFSSVHEGLRTLCSIVLDRMHEAGALRPDLDLDLEAERLHGLVDGLSLHAATGQTTAARVREILRRHLGELGADSP